VGGRLVDQPGDPLLARPALSGDEDGGVDLGHAARQVHQLPHGRAPGHHPQRLLDVGRHEDQRLAPLTELALRRLQRLGDPVERDVEALLEPGRLEEAELLGALVAPLLARAPEDLAGGVALADAAVLQDVDLVAGAAAAVAALQAADGPADRHVGAAEVQQVLLRLVGGAEQQALLGEGALAPRLDPEEPFQRVEAGARPGPVLVGVPLELGPQGLGHAPAVREAELGQDGAGGGEAEVLDQVLSQEPHGHRVDEERALPGEADQPGVRIELQQLLVVQLVGAHRDLPTGRGGWCAGRRRRPRRWRGPGRCAP